MTTYYVDASALVKRYIDEAGSDWVRATLSQSPPPSVMRAYDAVHLATAVVVNRHLLAEGLAPLIFLSADDRLDDAASAEEIAVHAPNSR